MYIARVIIRRRRRRRMPPLPPSRASSSSSSSSSESHKLVAFLFTLFAIVLCLSLAATNTGDDDDDDFYSLSGNEDAFLSTVVLDENNPAHPANLLKNVPTDDPERKKTYCAKVANVGDWYFGEKACEYAEMELDFAHSPLCTEKERAKKKMKTLLLFGWNRGRCVVLVASFVSAFLSRFRVLIFRFVSLSPRRRARFVLSLGWL